MTDTTRSRDRQRLFSETQRQQILAAQDHACAVCGNQLDVGFHAHHVIEHAKGGPTTIDNAMGVCRDCHRKAPIASLPNLVLRQWQKEAFTELLPKLIDDRTATLNAAPGAGKTKFALFLYQNLLARGLIDRLVVMVPNGNLRTQWADEARQYGIYLTPNSVTEPPGTDGVAITYHAWSRPKYVEIMESAARQKRTLFILDEVHHLARKSNKAEASAWTRQGFGLVGEDSVGHGMVLNMSGTLFRSKPDERISTVEYEQDAKGLISAIADYSILAEKLIGDGQLRPVQLLSVDAKLRVQGVDLKESASEGADEKRVIDLEDGKERRDVLLALLKHEKHFIRPMLKETVKRMGHVSGLLGGGAPVKGLVIANDVDHAMQVHAILVEMLGPRYAMIATSADSGADEGIRRFRESQGQSILVAVQKVSEGFDAPDVCVLAYMKTWTAPLFVNQMVGRAMRVSPAERAAHTIIPATVIIPHDLKMQTAFADVLVGPMGMPLQDPCDFCDQLVCACLPMREKQCQTCGMPWRNCICECKSCGKQRHGGGGCECPRKPAQRPLHMVEVLEPVALSGVHYNGQELPFKVFDAASEELAQRGHSPAHAAAAVAAVQTVGNKDPFRFYEEMVGRREA